MTQRLRFRLFAHSWVSDWNHGNAHFLRGLAYELQKAGHEVRCYEDVNCWSRTNLVQEGAEIADRSFRLFWSNFSDLDINFYSNDEGFESFAAEELRGADVVIVHEWNDPGIVGTILSLKPKYGFLALFHDTHHRAYTSPQQILRMPLHSFDGVLAFGEPIRRIYQEAFGVERAWTFHEAADTAHFRPSSVDKTTSVVWVGNWGDEERTAELEEFLIGPASSLKETVAAYGVRYPESALAKLHDAGIEFRGYLPNLDAPKNYAQSLVSLHIPRRFYANGLSGIPTIRMFEAMACGAPLICSPWTDTERLFRAGRDYISVESGPAMEAEIRNLLRDDAARRQLAANGLATVQRRHTCAHRADELLHICQELRR
jgi:spore maturation protein CgeB